MNITDRLIKIWFPKMIFQVGPKTEEVKTILNSFRDEVNARLIDLCYKHPIAKRCNIVITTNTEEAEDYYIFKVEANKPAIPGVLFVATRLGGKSIKMYFKEQDYKGRLDVKTLKGKEYEGAIRMDNEKE